MASSASSMSSFVPQVTTMLEQLDSALSSHQASAGSTDSISISLSVAQVNVLIELLRTAAIFPRAHARELRHRDALLEESNQLSMVFQLQCEQAVSENQRLHALLDTQVSTQSVAKVDSSQSRRMIFIPPPPQPVDLSDSNSSQPIASSSASMVPVSVSEEAQAAASTAHRKSVSRLPPAFIASGPPARVPESSAKDVFMPNGVLASVLEVERVSSQNNKAPAISALEASLLPQPMFSVNTQSDASVLTTACQLLPPGFVSVTNLELGDILLVQSGGAVALAQATSRIFAGSHSRDGAATSVHAALVVSKDNATGRIEVAHIIQSGIATDRLIDEPTDHFYRAIAYRLRDHPEVAAAAVQHGLDMVHANRIKFDGAGSVRSVFRELRVNEYLPVSDLEFQVKSKRRAQLEMESHCEWTEEIGQMSIYKMFCSEFVCQCYQEAIMGLIDHSDRSKTDRSLYRLMNVDPQSCPPMGLEGYLLSNSKSHADWQPQGIVSFNFW